MDFGCILGQIHNFFSKNDLFLCRKGAAGRTPKPHGTLKKTQILDGFPKIGMTGTTFHQNGSIFSGSGSHHIREAGNDHGFARKCHVLQKKKKEK